MVMIALLFLASATDSLPPSPDLSEVVFPEPPLHEMRPVSTLGLGGFAGNLYGMSGVIDTRYISARVAYEKKTDWDTVHSGSFRGSLDLPFHRFRFTPSVYGFRLQHQHDYVYLSPRVNFSAPTSWALLWGETSLDLWRINESHQFEHQSSLEMVFDKLIYKPHFEIRGLYTSQRMRAEAAWHMHIRNVHVSLRSPVAYDFPSPSLTIQYRDPLLTVKGTIRTGVMYHKLISYFDPDLPIAYTTIAPEESLRIGAKLLIAADLYLHVLSIEGSYDDWYNRIWVDDSFHITAVSDVQVFGMDVSARDSLHMGSLYFANRATMQFRRTDSTLSMLPRWAAQDTLTLRLAMFDAVLAARYRSAHDGLLKRLPAVLLAHGEFGMTIAPVRLFCRIINMTDIHDEWCDGYFFNGRQYGAGVTITHKF
jgi:hypothetical protein